MTATPPQPQPAQAEQLGEEDFFHWYGRWEPLSPATIGAFMAGFDRPWWIIGGWSIEAFTGVHREHDDLDISMLACDAEAFRLFLGERYTPWNVASGWLRPFDGRFGSVIPDSQLWVREHSAAPWILDVPLTPDTEGSWTNKRWPEHVAPVEDVTWVAGDGLTCLRPEITLMMKARLDREKDRADLAAGWPLLGPAERDWLVGAVAAAHPGHPWLSALV